MKQKIVTVAMLITLVSIIVGAYFIYDALKDDVVGGQLTIPNQQLPGGDSNNSSSNSSNNNSETNGGTSNGNSGTSSGNESPSTDSSGENNDAGSSENTSGSENSENDHDHGSSDENNDSGDHGNLTKAYDFTFFDANGNRVKLSDFFGKPIVLNFWASWCPPCQSEMPAFDEVYKEYGDNVQFIMVNLTSQDSVEDANSSIAKGGYSFPIYYDKEASGAYAYGVSSIPITFFIDKDGYMVAYGNFPFSKSTLLQGIDMIYKP